MGDESTEEVTTEQCHNCSDAVEQDDAAEINGEPHCQSCADEYGSCEDCDEFVLLDDLHKATRLNNWNWRPVTVHVCESCRDSNYSQCDGCNEYHSASMYEETLEGYSICEQCRDSGEYFYCEHCDGYTNDYSKHEHDDSCQCEPDSGLHFRVKNGEGFLSNDTRLALDLAGSVISDVGINLISTLIRQEGVQVACNRDDLAHLKAYSDVWYQARRFHDIAYEPWENFSWNFTDDVGSDWQTSRGNFTKRLSRAAHKAGLKLSPDLLTKVGNVAREQSAGSSVNLEFTRNLNLSAADFYHADSCWWQSYSDSRCALKTNGGIGLRTFDSNNRVTGRAWAMPLKRVSKTVPLGSIWVDGPKVMIDDPLYPGAAYPTWPEAGRKPLYGPERLIETFEPTFDTETPDAWMIFNGYGDLGGYNGARIMAQMSGLTYRKCEFEGSPMYVNAGGYIVGSEEDCVKVARDGVDLKIETHSDLYHNERRAAAQSEAA